MTRDARFDRLLGVFEQAAQEMAALPFANPALPVEWRGDAEHGDLRLSILTTPWSMALIALPADGTVPEVSEAERDLPCGRVRFAVARAEGVGVYLSCALFSDMTEFADAEACRAVADATLLQVMHDASAPVKAEPPPRDVSRRALFGFGGR